jgi:beta-lactamase regulating signal transducer with metallopeptidase domain
MLELALRSSVIFAAAWLLARLLPRAAAATRHLVWHSALVASLILALASLAQVRLVPQVALVPQVSQVHLVPQVQRVLGALEGVDAAETPQAGGTRSTGGTQGSRSALGTLGTLGVSLWFALGWLASRRLVQSARPAPAAWQLEVNALCERLRVRREVRLGILDRPTSPLATGVVRAVILLPAAAARWSDDRRRAVLLHELAHVRRHDCRVQIVAQTGCALFWFNPLVWLAASELRRERERACDDEVLQLGAQPSSYAAHLLDIAREFRPTLRPSAALAMARPSELEGRLLAVLAARRARVPARGTRWAIVTMVSLASAVALSATMRSPETPRLAPPAPARYVVSQDLETSAQRQTEPRSNAEATLEQSPDSQERERAALALALTSGRDVIPALLKALADPDSQVREKAAIGLALRRDPRVVEPLLGAMSDPDSQVREKVAIALGTSGDARAKDALTQALQDPDGQVREKAAAGLILLGVAR